MAMDPPPPPAARPSGIPRLSRLPVPKPSQAVTGNSLKNNTRLSGQLQLRGGESQPSMSGFSTSSPSDVHSFQSPVSKPRTQSKFKSRVGSSDGARNALTNTIAHDDNPASIPNESPSEGHDPLNESAEQDDFMDLTPAPTPKGRKPRPSLSDRTMDTLAKLPPTPGASRRRSGFFSPSSPTEPSSRPTSSLSNLRPGSSMSSRRPSVRDGLYSVARPESPTKRLTTPAKSSGSKGAPTPSKRSVSAAETTRSPNVKPPTGSRDITAQRTQQTPIKGTQGRAGLKLTGSHTFAARNLEPKPALGDVFKTEEPLKPQRKSASPKGSAALREQIAKAKAAQRAASNKSHVSQLDGQVDLDLHDDPFNQFPLGDEQVLKKRINIGRSEGRLNLAAMSLKSIPDAVMSMYDYDPDSDGAWSESVDMIRFIAADNEIKELPDSIFPDITPDDIANDEDSRGIQFGGLELLDMHGNLLRSVPLGLRRLERLTTLNLSHNNLENSIFDVITSVSSLRELKLTHNKLEGLLPSSVSQLENLETLELQNNRLSSLPESLQELIRLRVLHLSENNIASLPLKALKNLPLVELSAGKNKMEGVLFPPDVISMSKLQRLDVSNNRLSSLDAGELSLPSLRTLDISFNSVTSLPDVSTWTELLALLAEDNRISNLPEGLIQLEKVKSLDFTSNDLRHLDPRLSLMDSLEILKIAANPIREKKYLNMTTEDVKQELRLKIEPSLQKATHEEMQTDLHSAPITSDPAVGSLSLKSGGVLDLSSSSLSSLDDTLRTFDLSGNVRHLALDHNDFVSVPPQISLFANLRKLNLSHNNIADALEGPLFLPNLQDLNLSFNRIGSADLLTTFLVAPELHHLDLSSNRLTGFLVPLRTSFPSLMHLLASDNRLEGLTADALKGLRVANLGNNDIGALDAEIGLLWDEGLKSLEVGGNKFRVPGWRVLEKGTETVMAWLRDRIPQVDV